MGRRWHPSECKVCGARATHVHISATGLCLEHSVMTMTQNVNALRSHEGPEFDRWLRGIANGIVRTSRRRQAVDTTSEAA